MQQQPRLFPDRAGQRERPAGDTGAASGAWRGGTSLLLSLALARGCAGAGPRLAIGHEPEPGRESGPAYSVPAALLRGGGRAGNPTAAGRLALSRGGGMNAREVAMRSEADIMRHWPGQGVLPRAGINCTP